MDPKKINFGGKLEEHKCKICSLYNRNRELFDRIHKEVFVSGLSRRAVMLKVNAEINILNENLAEDDPFRYTEFNDVNFMTHFKKHFLTLNQYERFKMEELKLTSGESLLTEDERVLISLSGKGVADYYEDDEQSDFDDYYSMDELVANLEMIFIKRLKGATFSDLEGPLDIGLISKFTELTSSIIKLKKDLSQTRRSDSIAGKAVDDVSREIIKMLVLRLTMKFDEAEALIAAETHSPKFAKQIRQMVFDDIKNHVQDNANGVIQKVKRHYKIKK
jgi:hypothetical protein